MRSTRHQLVRGALYWGLPVPDAGIQKKALRVSAREDVLLQVFVPSTEGHSLPGITVSTGYGTYWVQRTEDSSAPGMVQPMTSTGTGYGSRMRTAPCLRVGAAASGS
eukprot:3675850-Rhodomonas_salina.1